MEQFSRLEIFLGALVLLEAIAIVVLWLRKHASGDVVVLEPGKDKLQVDYWWIDVRDITDDAEINLNKLYKTEGKEEIIYEYDVEGTRILVSKQGSNAVATHKGAIRPPSKKPPPLHEVEAVLMAIEITVL